MVSGASTGARPDPLPLILGFQLFVWEVEMMAAILSLLTAHRESREAVSEGSLILGVLRVPAAVACGDGKEKPSCFKMRRLFARFAAFETV